MVNYKEDTDQNLGTIIFIILFFLFVIAFSNNRASHTSSSAKCSLYFEEVFGDFSSHSNAILYKSVKLPDLQEYCECALHITSLNPFSIQNKISDYNRRIAQNFILNKKTKLSTGPVLLLKLYYHLPSNKDDNLPVLS